MSIDFSDFGFAITGEFVEVTCLECQASVMRMQDSGQISDITESCREHAEATGHGAVSSEEGIR